MTIIALQPLTSRRVNWVILSVTVLLLFAAWLRLRHIVDFVEWPDEIYTVWNAQGTLSDRLVRTDPYWPPLHGYVVWAWRQLAGPTLEVQRVLSVFISLLATASVYRIGRRLGGLRTGAASALLYAVMGYAVFTGVDVRGYSLLLLFLPLTLWMTIRWLAVPTKRRAWSVVFTLALLLHTGFSALVCIPLLTLWVLVVQPDLFWRWCLVGLAVLGLTAPIIPQFVQENVLGRFDVVSPQLPPLIEALALIYRDFGGSIIFLALLCLAAITLIAIVRRPPVRQTALLLALWILSPIVLYVAVGNRDFWRPRYMWWVLPGLALFIGFALSCWPRKAFPLMLMALATLAWVPVEDSSYRLAATVSPPFRHVFSWFAQQLRPGDVLVIDPHCTCGEPYGWDYFVPLYFPTGYLPVVEEPGDTPRVWYLSNDGWDRDEALFAAISRGRRPSIFVGPWHFLLRLYEGPPDPKGISFGGQVRFHGAEIEGNQTVMGKHERFRVKLWWSADQRLSVDYSMSLAVLDGRGRMVAQADGPARSPDTPEQTSVWEPQVVYEDFRELQLPGNLKAGGYQLVVVVYQWWDGVRLPPEVGFADADALIIKKLQIVSF